MTYIFIILWNNWYTKKCQYFIEMSILSTRRVLCLHRCVTLWKLFFCETTLKTNTLQYTYSQMWKIFCKFFVLNRFLTQVVFFKEIAKLGEVIRLSQVQMTSLSGDKHDRIFVLFPSLLVMLSMSPRLSGYQYEVRTNSILA